ncbi:hypothetical protein Sjap_001793 [Stephania japonica]|uniref:Exostosin GT47 domain-containing protein n=1 Tax=Stephania japonica TaxID=461633 RepID=A0AAP0PRV1_9MAGN
MLKAKMEKSDNVAKGRIRFWFFICASLVLSVSLFCFNFSALIRDKKETQFKDPYILGFSPQKPHLLLSDTDLDVSHLTTWDDDLSSVNRSGVRETGTRSIHSDKSGVKDIDDLPIVEDGSELITSHANGEKAGRINKPNEESRVTAVESSSREDTSLELDPCKDKYVYVYDLPSNFNSDILKNCKAISLWINMCHYLTNMGLGPRLGGSQGVFTVKGWFATDQFALDVVFHNRMKQYKCLTKNSSMAAAIFVPFYAGLDVSPYLWGYNTSMRDSSALELVKWLAARPEWKVWDGRDHFLVAGRITWDLRRTTDEDKDWGSNLMELSEAKNMTMLVIESSPWHGNDVAIPYPTYFHPSTDNQVFEWQNRMRRLRKRYLFSFAGAPRPKLTGSIRNHIIKQCQASKKRCKLLECNRGGDKCHHPSNVMKMFQSSTFCLQPPGDSYTRRSTFDSILAGCIPVFFHPGSAYVQYLWHLPRDFSKYSVLIPEDEVRKGKTDIESRLRSISAMQVKAMREEVIRLIPRVIYADPRSRLETIEDAFDIAVEGVIERVKKAKREMLEARPYDNDANEEANNWKHEFFGTTEKHEWDHFFSKKIVNSL